MTNELQVAFQDKRSLTAIFCIAFAEIYEIVYDWLAASIEAIDNNNFPLPSATKSPAGNNAALSSDIGLAVQNAFRNLTTP